MIPKMNTTERLMWAAIYGATAALQERDQFLKGLPPGQIDTARNHNTAEEAADRRILLWRHIAGWDGE